MGRPHLLCFFHTFEVREDGGEPRLARLIGYEPPDELDKALKVAETALAAHGGRRAIAIPDEESLRHASEKELEQWANHLLSNGALPAPGESVDRHDLDQRMEFGAALQWWRQYRQAMRVMDAMVSAQKAFMQTGDWLERKRLTVPMAAARAGVSGRTAYRIIEASWLRFQGATFEARHLLCRDNLAEIARALLPVARANPGWGAPRLTAELKRQGIRTSQRSVGKALRELRMRLML